MTGGQRRFILLAVCACLLLGCSATGSDRSKVAVASTPADTLGVYHGPVALDRIASFERRLGRKVTFGHDYLDKRSWEKMENVSWLTRPWISAGFKGRVVLTVPMLPNTGGTLARGAAGSYDGHFRTLAHNLVRAGFGSAVLRLGHEFNGTWYRWSIKARRGGKNFAAYWRHIVTTMRSVPGARFAFDWSPVAGSSYVKRGKRRLRAASAWPGDAYVDFVGLDVFDQSYIPKYRNATARWKNYVRQHDGLAWHAKFAAAHRKPMTFPEWGLSDRIDGHGGADNPYFIRQMYNWIQSHNVAYHLYFETHDGEGDFGVFSGWFPKAANTFIDLFGSRAGVGRIIGLQEQPQLYISRAQVLRSSRLKASARFSPRVSGEARVQLAAGGRRVRFSAHLRSGSGAMRINRRLTRAMSRSRTGMVTFAYGGDDDTHPQLVRLLAGPGDPQLRVEQKTLAGGRVSLSGKISRQARGAVVVQLRYVVDAQIATRSFSTRIRNGRWSLSSPLGDLIGAEIDRRQGPVTASVLYQGSSPRRIRGELRSYPLLGPR
ncbi:MAG: glycoside hydrolase family 26 protein [Solirubrobacteraceae bacterium]